MTTSEIGIIDKSKDTTAELGRDPISKRIFSLSMADAGGDCRTRLAKPNSQVRTGTGVSGANGDRETLIFPV